MACSFALWPHISYPISTDSLISLSFDLRRSWRFRVSGVLTRVITPFVPLMYVLQRFSAHKIYYRLRSLTEMSYVTRTSNTRSLERKSSTLYILKASLTLSLPMNYIILRTTIPWSRLVPSSLWRLLWLCFLFLSSTFRRDSESKRSTRILPLNVVALARHSKTAKPTLAVGYGQTWL